MFVSRGYHSLRQKKSWNLKKENSHKPLLSFDNNLYTCAGLAKDICLNHPLQNRPNFIAEDYIFSCEEAIEVFASNRTEDDWKINVSVTLYRIEVGSPKYGLKVGFIVNLHISWKQLTKIYCWRLHFLLKRSNWSCWPQNCIFIGGFLCLKLTFIVM